MRNFTDHIGKNFEFEWVHIWKFRDEKICGHQAFWNTYRIVNALN
ncbi:MAG: hypothetical protein ABIR66_00340 [Saprospiraceae bacterium]